MKPFEEIISARNVRLVDCGEDGGAFIYRRPNGDRPLMVIVSWGMEWDHVSVSARGKTPSWVEMEAVKRLCFNPDEVAMQLHVAERNHISIKHNCLHIWRPQGVVIPTPPEIMV